MPIKQNRNTYIKNPPFAGIVMLKYRFLNYTDDKNMKMMFEYEDRVRELLFPPRFRIENISIVLY